MKVSDSKTIQSLSKKKKTSKASSADAASFAGMVDKTGDISDIQAPSGVDALSALNSVVLDDDAFYVPTEGKARGYLILDLLEELEKEILSGEPSQAIERLRIALDTQAVNLDELSPKVKELLEEIDVRASIEVAKLEAAKK